MVREHQNKAIHVPRAPYSGILEDCLRSMVQKQVFDHRTKTKSDDNSHHRRLCYAPAFPSGPENTGELSQNSGKMSCQQMGHALACLALRWIPAVSSTPPRSTHWYSMLLNE